MKKILVILIALYFTNSFSNNKELYHRVKIEYNNSLENIESVEKLNEKFF